MAIFLDAKHVMTFRPFEGYSLEQIYQYAPKYINWLVTHTDQYFIDFSQFENLPTPTPYEYTERIQVILGQGPFLEFAVTGRDQIQDALDYKAAGNIIPEKPHIFSEHVRGINQNKRNGESYVPIRYVPFRN